MDIIEGQKQSSGITVAELADMVKGRIIGSFNTKAKVVGTCAIDKYVKDKVSFVGSQKYGEALAQLQNAVILISEDLANFYKNYPRNTYIVVEDVVKSLMDVQGFFYSNELTITEEGTSPKAKIDGSAEIGNQVYIGENVYISKNVVIGNRAKIINGSYISDNVTIGSGTHIYPGVCIYKNCQIGDDCIIHSGTRIGADGFRFEQDIKRKVVQKVLHVGGVIIGDRIEIGTNSTIDRATFEDDATVLYDDVKLDDQVHIGHNAKIGARTIIAAQTCVSGSVTVGEDVWIGAGVTISDSVRIGNRAKVLLNAVVAYDVAEDQMVSGFYAMPHRQWKRVYERLKEEI